MLNESQVIVSDSQATQELFMEFSESLFGVKPENVQPTVWDGAFKWISERFIGITINDITEAYNCAEIEKKPYTTLTRDELISPIKSYWHKKTNLIGALTEIQKEEKDTEDKRQAFRKEAESIYLESLEKCEWIGDLFHANALARDYAGRICQKEKDEMWYDALKEQANKANEVNDSLTENPFAKVLPVPGPIFFYSNKIMKWAVENKIYLIVE